MEGFKTKIIALFLGFTVCASAQQFSGVADISSVTSAGGSNYTVNVYSFNGGYLLGGSTQYTALSIQAGDLMWWNCDTFRIVSTSGGNPDGIAFTISVGGGQGTPSPNSRVAFVRETEDQTQPLPYIGFNSPFGLSSDVWQCIQAYYAEHYRRIWKDSTSAAEYNKVQFSKDSVFSRIVDSDKTTQIWQDADSIALRKSKSGYASWIHVVTDSVTTQVNGNPFRVTGDSVSLGRKPANYLFNVGALLSEYSATPKSYVDSLVAAGGGGGSVSSVFGRTGAVTAASGDYTATQVTNTPEGNIAATTVQAALNELDTEKLSAEVDGSVTNEIELPSQSGNSGKYLTTDGFEPSWSRVSGGTPGGSTTEIQYNNAGSFDGQSNITTTEGATTGNEMSIAGGSVTTGKALNVTANALTTGSVVNVSSTSTAAGGNTQTGLNVSLSGANGTSTQTTYGAQIANTHTGTSSTNVGLNVTASGGANNYAAIFTGSVGIGTTTPQYPFHISSSGLTRFGVQYGSASYGGIEFRTSGNEYWGFYVGGPTYSSGYANIFGIWQWRNAAGTAVNKYRLFIANSGNVGIGIEGESAVTSKLMVDGDNGYTQFRLADSYTPTGSSDTNGATGQVAWDADYIYIKTAAGWKRSALSTF